MTESKRRLGEALLDALNRMRGPVEFAPGEIEAEAEALQLRLARARRELDEEDLVAFCNGEGNLSRSLQRRLFTDPSLRDRFRALQHERAVTLPVGSAGRPDAIAEMPQRTAAADPPEIPFTRKLAGGSLSVDKVGIEQQVYVVIQFDPGVSARRLVIERPLDGRVIRLDLSPADDGEVVLIKDLAVSEEAELIELLGDPSASGPFLS
jgi:hypothetical protein